jgi:hypothetical protein
MDPSNRDPISPEQEIWTRAIGPKGHIVIYYCWGFPQSKKYGPIVIGRQRFPFGLLVHYAEILTPQSKIKEPRGVNQRNTISVEWF